MSAATPSEVPSPPPDAEVVYEGVMAVAPPPAPIYRYALVLKGDQIRMWLEDCDSKKNWSINNLRRTSELSLETYVNSTNSVACAGPADYIQYFHEVMSNTTREEATDIPVGFYPIEGGKFRLELAVKGRVLNQDLVAIYSFDLEEISEERIDKLEAEVRELQGVVATLYKDLKIRDAGNHSRVLNAQGTGKLGDTLIWDKISEVPTPSVPISVIPVDTPGLYQAVVVVNCVWNGSEIKLMKGRECIQSVYCGYSEKYPGSTTLTCICRLERGDQLFVVCTADIVATNRLTLARLGP